jgi:cytochrome P450
VLGGKTIPQGAFVFLCWASGNRDPQRFAEPDKFDPDRTNTNQHLAFGTGVHFCLGAMLARQEMKCAIREIVNSVESLDLAVSADQLDLSTSMVILRGLKSLPVRFHEVAATKWPPKPYALPQMAPPSTGAAMVHHGVALRKPPRDFGSAF